MKFGILRDGFLSHDDRASCRPRFRGHLGVRTQRREYEVSTDSDTSSESLYGTWGTGASE